MAGVALREPAGTPVDAPVGLLVVGHGSRRPEANAVLVAVADAVRARSAVHAVRPAFLEIAEPSIGAAFDALVADGARRVVVHPYFLYPGNHTTHDIPAELAVAEARHPGVTWLLTAALELDERIVDVVLDRVRTTLEAP
jgi:sirohydrochlorin cobaltochelatase